MKNLLLSAASTRFGIHKLRTIGRRSIHLHSMLFKIDTPASGMASLSPPYIHRHYHLIIHDNLEPWHGVRKFDVSMTYISTTFSI